MNTLPRLIAGWFKPRFNELASFQLAIICIVSLSAYPDLRLALGKVLQDTTGVGAWALAMGLIMFIGLALSVLHVFVSWKKTAWEKSFMGAFALAIFGLGGIAAGIEMLPAKWSVLTILTIWNIVYGVILFYKIGFAEITLIDDENALWLEVVIATVLLLLVFAVADYVLHLSWAFTVSMCLTFVSAATTPIIWAVQRFNSLAMNRNKLPNTGSRRERLHR